MIALKKSYIFSSKLRRPCFFLDFRFSRSMTRSVLIIIQFATKLSFPRPLGLRRSRRRRRLSLSVLRRPSVFPHLSNSNHRRLGKHNQLQRAKSSKSQQRSLLQQLDVRTNTLI